MLLTVLSRPCDTDHSIILPVHFRPFRFWPLAGVATADVGIGKDHKPKDNFSRGMELRAKQTLFAEGARGSCSEDVMAQFRLRAEVDPQVSA